ncbi:MAG TPA: response regulator [Gemmataceae bacterium]|nr:response regulator [Gemmataceae bacterium]
MTEFIGKKILLRAEFNAPDLPTGPTRPGILVVVRDPGVLSLMELVLRRRGFVVRRASNPKEALAECRAARGALDLLLADVDLPGMDVAEMMIRLRLLKPGLRFCFITGEGPTRARPDLTTLGATWVFPKPFPVDEVVEILWQLAGDERRQKA